MFSFIVALEPFQKYPMVNPQKRLEVWPLKAITKSSRQAMWNARSDSISHKEIKVSWGPD